MPPRRRGRRSRLGSLGAIAASAAAGVVATGRPQPSQRTRRRQAANTTRAITSRNAGSSSGGRGSTCPKSVASGGIVVTGSADPESDANCGDRSANGTSPPAATAANSTATMMPASTAAAALRSTGSGYFGRRDGPRRRALSHRRSSARLQSNLMTLRATLPVFMSAKPSLISSRVMVLDTMSSS